MAEGVTAALDPSDAPPSQADRLVQLATGEGTELFHDTEGRAFADVTVDARRETHPIHSRAYRLSLGGAFYRVTGKAPASQPMNDALGVIEAKAIHDGANREVHVRVAFIGGRLFLDLGTPDWTAVEVTPAGWRTVADPPNVRFIRPKGLLPLPQPVAGTERTLRPADRLGRFLNVADEAGFRLAVAWLLAALGGRGPYPALVLQGEQGSAKSTAARLLRALVDPNSAALRSMPREERDLFIAATNGHALCFDNISNLPPWLSDALCRLATGGGFAVRTLYADAEETLFTATRPILMTGIGDVATRPDLVDRALILDLLPIPDHARRKEAELWGAFDREAPMILGGLLDAVAHGLKALPSVKLDRLPRMADFAAWAVACEGVLGWPVPAFMDAYEDNRAAAIEDVVENDPVASTALAMMRGRDRWGGTAKELLDDLTRHAGDNIRRGRVWPTHPRVLMDRLTRAAPALRALGLEFHVPKERTNRGRAVSLSWRRDESGISSSPSSQRDGVPEKHNEHNGLTGDDRVTVGDDDGSIVISSSLANGREKTNTANGLACGRDDGDDSDDKNRFSSDRKQRGAAPVSAGRRKVTL